MPTPTTPVITDANVTVTEIETALADVDLPVVAMAINEADLCVGGPQSPSLRMIRVSAGEALNLVIPTQQGMNYEVQFTGSLSQPFGTVETINGSGSEITYPIGTPGAGDGFYRVLVVPSEQ